jgi:uncharacterized MAPEG superfamily protein
MSLAIAYWCVLVAALLPYAWVLVAKTSGDRYDNRDPRGWIARQTSARVHRADAAQLNGYEAFAPFAAGVVLAQLAGVAAERIALLSLIFVVFRILHGLVYVAGWKHSLRSLVWSVAFVCVVLLYVQAALQVA